MIVVKHTNDFYTIECNACGERLTELYPDEYMAREDADMHGYFEIGELHYCPKCWKGFAIGEGKNAKGIIVTADMRVWDANAEKEIKPVIM